MMDQKLINEASKKLRIKEIFMLNNFCQRDENYLPPYTFEKSDTKKLQFKQYVEGYQIAVGENKIEEYDHVIYHYKTGFRLVDDVDKDNEDILFTCEAEFAAVYLISEDLREEELEEFGKYNVGYHVWPYWREHCATISQKNRLPFKIPIPFYQNPE